MMDVAHFKTGALSRESARPHRRNASLVLQLRQRIYLIHKLGELGGGEKFPRHGQKRTGIDELNRSQGLRFISGHSVLNDAPQPRETDPQAALKQLADGTDAAISEMINVVRFGVLIVVEPDNFSDNFNNIA